MADSTFNLTFSKFYQGFSPLAHLNSLTPSGNAGHASVMTNCDVLSDLLTQGPALTNLTNGTQAGVVSELINFIMDKAVADDTTYGIGPTKLFKISSTTVASGGTPSWPRTITNCTDGESVINMGGKLYYLYNTSTAGDIGRYDLSAEFIDAWGSTTPTGFAALQKANHPSASKEDLILFGNGRYLGTYIGDSTTLAPAKLDFGSGTSVDDVIFHANQWIIAVNSGITGTNRTIGQVYIYDGGALSSILSDEAGVGFQRIGWLYELNGIVYIAYQDLSSTGGYKIGYLAGRQIKPLGYFTGSLPNFAQKTLFKGTILFVSSGLIYSAGAIIDEFPFQISQLADGGYATVGALAAPFGTPMVASTESTNFKLAKFSGYDVSCSWKSIIIPTVSGRYKGYVDEIVVLTKTLGASARCDLTIEADQATSTSTTQQITGTSKRKHIFNNFGLITLEDFRIALSWANGNASNDCAIREIQVFGHYTN